MSSNFRLFVGGPLHGKLIEIVGNTPVYVMAKVDDEYPVAYWRRKMILTDPEGKRHSLPMFTPGGSEPEQGIVAAAFTLAFGASIGMEDEPA